MSLEEDRTFLDEDLTPPEKREVPDHPDEKKEQPVQEESPLVTGGSEWSRRSAFIAFRFMVLIVALAVSYLSGLATYYVGHFLSSYVLPYVVIVIIFFIILEWGTGLRIRQGFWSCVHRVLDWLYRTIDKIRNKIPGP